MEKVSKRKKREREREKKKMKERGILTKGIKKCN